MTGRKVRRSVKVDDLNDPFQNKSLNGAVSVKDGIGIGKDCTAEGKGGLEVLVIQIAVLDTISQRTARLRPFSVLPS